MVNREIGLVELNVANLPAIKGFYHDIVGLEVLDESDSSCTLCRNGTPIFKLVEKTDLSFPQPGSAGLYHTAILFESRDELAKTLLNVFQKAPDSFEGSGDHLVSQAFYFHDPEGNGLELYFDRPRDQWIWENGQVKMATLYIDPMEFIQENIQATPVSTNAHVGHIHLKVGDIQQARKFYVDVVGFDVTAQIPEHNPSALFVSAGGYHHHIGLNTWESAGAGKRSPSIGLNSFEVIIETDQDFNEVMSRLQSNSITYTNEESTLVVQDPWNNTVIFRLISKLS